MPWQFQCRQNKVATLRPQKTSALRSKHPMTSSQLEYFENQQLECKRFFNQVATAVLPSIQTNGNA
jgi:hypothetical protein